MGGEVSVGDRRVYNTEGERDKDRAISTRLEQQCSACVSARSAPVRAWTARMGKERGVMEPNDSAPLVQQIGATSIAEIEKLIGELQETRNFLESEGERIQRETARYIDLTKRALASVRIIFDTLSGWQQAGHPMRESVTT